MAEERSFLPEAIEEEILVRLPLKSIFKFESVSKRLYSLFRSKAFSDFYFGHHQVSIPTKKDLRLSYPDLRIRGRRRCRGRRSLTWATGPLSNGIYCLVSILMKDDRYLFPHTLKIGLFNPATRQIKFAAPFPAEYLPRLTGISSHTTTVSCGIDDDYRVVVLIHYEINTQNTIRLCYLFFLYTWRTGEWELIIDYNPGRCQIGLPPGTNVFEDMIMLMEDMPACSNKLLNGCWHWLTHHCDDEDKENHGIRFNVLSFHFERKSLGLIPGPMCKINTRADVFVLQDHLAVIVTPGSASEPLLQIWMKMKDPETIWTNIYSVHPILDPFFFPLSILYGVDYYQVQEEPELIRIKSVKLLIIGKLFTFDDEGGHQVAEEEEDSDQIPLSVAGISMFRPTLERLPDLTQFKA